MDSPENLSVAELEENDLETIEEHEPEQNTEEQPGGENEEENADKPVKPKRVVRNPRPKLNAETLKGKRGITALESYFERVKYKGQGHEEQDLSVILKTYEYWCHRLFPKYPFDECIAKIEHLGTKRPVVTHVKKIRTNLLLDENPTVNDDSVVDEVPNNEFDDLFDTPLEEPSNEISEEQLEQIRLNKERAEKLRKEKLMQKREVTQGNELQNIESADFDLTNDDIHFSDVTGQASNASFELPSDQQNDDSICQKVQRDEESINDAS